MVLLGCEHRWSLLLLVTSPQLEGFFPAQRRSLLWAGGLGELWMGLLVVELALATFALDLVKGCAFSLHHVPGKDARLHCVGFLVLAPVVCLKKEQAPL